MSTRNDFLKHCSNVWLAIQAISHLQELDKQVSRRCKKRLPTSSLSAFHLLSYLSSLTVAPSGLALSHSCGNPGGESRPFLETRGFQGQEAAELGVTPELGSG